MTLDLVHWRNLFDAAPPPRPFTAAPQPAKPLRPPAQDAPATCCAAQALRWTAHPRRREPSIPPARAVPPEPDRRKAGRQADSGFPPRTGELGVFDAAHDVMRCIGLRHVLKLTPTSR